jgi:ribosomal protein S18 acetylase RimI-like enzyme
MKPDITIRPLQGQEELRDCARMMATSEPWITLQRDYAASLHNLASPEKEIHVAVQGNTLLGFVVLNLHGAFVGYMQSLCVAPEWRRCGVGRKLITFAEERVFRDHPNMFVCVSSFNPDAQRFYRSLGYELIGELRNFIVAGHSEILLRKSVAPLTKFRKEARST